MKQLYIRSVLYTRQKQNHFVLRNDIQIVYAEKLHSTAVGSCCQHTLNQPSATELKGKVYYSNIFIILVPRKEREEENEGMSQKTVEVVQRNHAIRGV